MTAVTKVVISSARGLRGFTGPANSTYSTTPELEAAEVTNLSAILTEAGKAGTFTLRDYVDFSALVASDTAKINYIRSTTDTSKVWVRAKNNDTVSPEDYNAKGDGATDDSAAYVAGFSARRNLIPAAGRAYAVKELILSNSRSLLGNNAIYFSAAGATHMFRLQDFDPRLSDVRISGNVGAAAAAIRIAKSRGARVEKVAAVATGYGLLDIRPDNPATEFVALPFIHALQSEQVDTVGVFIGSSVSELRGGDVHLHGTLVVGSDAVNLKPKPGTVGWRQNQPLVAPNNYARGGHQLSQLNMIGLETGFWFTDVELINYGNIIADGCSGFGIVFDGTGNGRAIHLAEAFIGTSRGYRGAGNSVVVVNGLETIFNGTIPPWASPDFFNGTCYDVTLEDQAVLVVSGYWQGDKKLNIASTARLVVLCGEKIRGRTVGTIASGTTNYLAEWGQTPTEGDTIWRADCNGQIIGVTALSVAAPGSGESFAYTVRKNFADTGLVATMSGGAAFGGDTWSTTGGIQVARNDQISLKLVTSAGAAATRHFTVLHFVPDERP